MLKALNSIFKIPDFLKGRVQIARKSRRVMAEPGEPRDKQGHDDFLGEVYHPRVQMPFPLILYATDADPLVTVRKNRI